MYIHCICIYVSCTMHWHAKTIFHLFSGMPIWNMAKKIFLTKSNNYLQKLNSICSRIFFSGIAGVKGRTVTCGCLNPLKMCLLDIFLVKSPCQHLLVSFINFLKTFKGILKSSNKMIDWLLFVLRPMDILLIYSGWK